MSGLGCLKQAGLVQNFNLDMKASKAKLVFFFLSTIWWFDAQKRIKKIILKNAFEQRKQKPGLNFKPRVSANWLSKYWALEGGENWYHPRPPPSLHHPNKWKEENLKTGVFTFDNLFWSLRTQSGLLTYAELIVLSWCSLHRSWGIATCKGI